MGANAGGHAGERQTEDRFAGRPHDALYAKRRGCTEHVVGRHQVVLKGCDIGCEPGRRYAGQMDDALRNFEGAPALDGSCRAANCIHRLTHVVEIGL